LDERPADRTAWLARKAWLAHLVTSAALAGWVTTGHGPSWLYTVVALGAVAATAIGTGGVLHSRRRRTAAWLAGLACWVTGDVIWSLLGAHAQHRFPTGVDALYLTGYALLLRAVHRSGPAQVADGDATIDALVVTAGAAGLVGIHLVQVALSASASVEARTVAAAYPVLSLALVGGMVRNLLATRTRRVPIALLALGFTSQLVADSIYALTSISGAYDRRIEAIGWLAAYTLFGAAALHPAAAESPARRNVREMSLSRARIGVLAAASLAPLLGHLWFGLPEPVALGLCLAITGASVHRVAQPIEAMRKATGQDELTGLRNRPAILDAIDDVLADDGRIAVLHVDVDGLHLVNDALGHVAGDAVIRTVGQRLDAVAGPGRTARITGDEFVVLAPAADEAAGVDLARRIQACVAEATAVNGLLLRPTTSIGVAVSDHGEGGRDLLRRAATALSSALPGRERLAVASSDDDGFLRLRLAEDLRSAIADGGITVAFQPEVSVATGELFGFEALARWTHPTLGPVAPDVFVPVAEETGLVRPLFAAVLEDALAAQQLWASTGAVVPVAVNVSPVQLGPELVDDIRAALDRWRPTPGTLWIEITESTVDDLGAALPVIDELRGLGVKLAIDDFGTGHSSLARLAAVEWHALKIDRTFVDRLLCDPHARAVTAAMVGMAQHLGIRTIAEGVETAEQREELTRLGCDVLQGYLLSRPVDAAGAAALVARRTGASLG
jgi:diguanylate cyclase (GGDEF)-like protein